MEVGCQNYLATNAMETALTVGPPGGACVALVTPTTSLRVNKILTRKVYVPKAVKRHTMLESTFTDFYTISDPHSTQLPQMDGYHRCRKRSNQVRATIAEKHKEASPILSPIPKSINDISNGDHILGFGANLGEDHPGYQDSEYKRRRSFIADLAKTHTMGEPIPDVDYSMEETRVWGDVLNTLVGLYPTHACKEYLNAYQLFNFTPDWIPQLQELSEILQRTTGWRIRPVAGLLHPRDFLNGLAFRTFHSTQYIRHRSNPMYTPEPDICHEILGHVPMLADPEYAELAWVIGQASLGASEKDIWHLTKLYWYTVEFGTVKERNEVRAFGAGLLSSFGELKHMRDGTGDVMPEFVELDPFKKLPKMSYKDGFQKKYFLCDSFADAAAKLRTYSRSILHPEVEAMALGSTWI